MRSGNFEHRDDMASERPRLTLSVSFTVRTDPAADRPAPQQFNLGSPVPIVKTQ